MASPLHLIRTELRHLDVSRRALRSFGLLVGGVVLGIAVFVAWRRGWTLDGAPTILGGLGGVLMVLGLGAPLLLRPVYRAWMALALTLGFVMTRVLLTVFFVVVMTPAGVLRRTFGRSPILEHPDPATPSYWVTRDPVVDPRTRMEKMY